MSNQNGRKSSISKGISIITIPEIINNKFLNESNIIVNEIIEKIISLVISVNFNKKIEQKISSTCYNFVENTINVYLSSNFITHDKDETTQDGTFHIKDELIQEIEPISIRNDFSNIEGYSINNSKNQSNLKLEENYFFSNCCGGDNDWDIMSEPKSNGFDRYAATLIKFREIETEKNLKYNKKGGDVLQEINEESEKNSVVIGEKNETIPSKKEGKNYYKYAVNNTNNKNKKKNLLDINQFSFHDLDNNDDLYIEPKEINFEKLRKEAQEKQNIIKEVKKVSRNAKIEVENKIREEVEKNKQYNGKKITVDANGQIVLIKGIKLDKLVKEFNSLKTSTKLIKEEGKKIKKKRRLSQEEIIKENKEEVEKKKEAEKNKANEEKDQKLPKGQKILPKIKGNKFRSSNKELLEENNKSKLMKKIEEGPIIPSGSNFELMNMEVGVTIKENEKTKTGGKDFYHKYNKYSIDNYNKQLKETTEMNSFLKSPTEVEMPITKSDINYAGNFTDTYNSSIGFINNNSNINHMGMNSKNYQLTNYNTLSNFGNKSIKSKVLNSSISPKLKLSIGNGSLLGSIEKLSLITERQERLAKKAENIFKNNLSNYSSAKEIVLPKLEEINKFTSEILTSKNWAKRSGINNNFGSPFRNPGKPGFKEISREMGIRGKILRNRMKKKIEKQDINPALITVDFFKK